MSVIGIYHHLKRSLNATKYQSIAFQIPIFADRCSSQEFSRDCISGELQWK